MRLTGNHYQYDVDAELAAGRWTILVYPFRQARPRAATLRHSSMSVRSVSRRNMTKRRRRVTLRVSSRAAGKCGAGLRRQTMRERVLVAAGVLLWTLLAPATAGAQTAATSAAADAFGVRVITSPLQQEPIRVGPVPEVNVYEPPESPAEVDRVAEVGPIPDDGALVEFVRAVVVTGDGEVSEGRAVATAETAAVSLLGGQVTATALRAVSTTTCPGPGSVEEASEGSEVVNLTIGGQEIPLTPEPNQVEIEIPGVARISVFEVIPDADGLGFTTRMLHIRTLDPLTQAVNAEIIVAEAHSTVSCDGDEQTAGEDNDIFIEKGVSPSTVRPGEEVTYDITVRNQSEETCVLFEVTDRLPPGFEFVSVGGDLAAFDEEPMLEGREVRFENFEGLSLEPDATLTGTLVVRIPESTRPGTYFNDVLVRSTCGNFEKGHDAPVTVSAAPAPAAPAPQDDKGVVAQPPAAPAPEPAPDPALPATGAALPALLGLALAGAGAWLRRR
jgi:uncharacterized repeat protein (TIGR01451 family)